MTIIQVSLCSWEGRGRNRCRRGFCTHGGMPDKRITVRCSQYKGNERLLFVHSQQNLKSIAVVKYFNTTSQGLFSLTDSLLLLCKHLVPSDSSSAFFIPLQSYAEYGFLIIGSPFLFEQDNNSGYVEQRILVLDIYDVSSFS